MHCTGVESALLDCNNDGIGVHSQSCDHTTNAAVQCTGKYQYLCIIVNTVKKKEKKKQKARFPWSLYGILKIYYQLAD